MKSGTHLLLLTLTFLFLLFIHCLESLRIDLETSLLQQGLSSILLGTRCTTTLCHWVGGVLADLGHAILDRGRVMLREAAMLCLVLRASVGCRSLSLKVVFLLILPTTVLTIVLVI